MAFSGIKLSKPGHSHLQTPVSRFMYRDSVIGNFHIWKRKRLKIRTKFVVCNSLNVNLIFFDQFRDAFIKPPVEVFDNLFQNLLSQISSVHSLDLFAPALGLASGLALFLSGRSNSAFLDVGEWVLFTNPTPFNRFVLLRCPSISFEDGELLEDVNEKLVKDDRHFVKVANNGFLTGCLRSGSIPGVSSISDYDNGGLREKLVYQRVCLHTDDGGVVSLDWPANLDLTKEHGLDATLLLVPGTTDGSMDGDIRSFTSQSLKYGYFPLVMNPRGCAGSPLTTARLFTAADSDDICTAIQFVNRSRPWTTLMGVGWGYGANMLTKYLSEVGDRSPLTAAACINNPFDLEEATRSFPYHIAVDKKLMSGLKDILRANKELFQGRTKGFNVAGGLSATSVRDFERAISMVSYGFGTIEEFYSKSSTRELVGNIKIPVLFIQNDDGTVPIFSIPRSSIAENPFTSLLMCSCLPSHTSARKERSALPWCQNLVMEWLSAVELALLKGRHPLLKDVDVTINPSKGLAFGGDRTLKKKTIAESKISSPSDIGHSYLIHKNENADRFSNLTGPEAPNRYSVDPSGSILDDTDNRSATTHLQSGRDLTMKWGRESPELQQDMNISFLQKSKPLDAQGPKEGEVVPDEGTERSEVLQTAEVVMNMLDVTLPGTLAEQQKKKVLSAMEQGETFMKALEGAVPEDVRGKLSASVSEIVQTQGTKLNLSGCMKIDWIPNVTSEVKYKIQEKFKGFSRDKGGLDGGFSTEGKYVEGDDSQETKSRLDIDLVNPSSSNEKHVIQSPLGSESEATFKLQEPLDAGPTQLDTGHGFDSSYIKDPNASEHNHQQCELSQDKTAQVSENVEIGLETGDKHHSQTATASRTQEVADEQDSGNQNTAEAGGLSADDQAMTKEVDNIQEKERNIQAANSVDSSQSISLSPEPRMEKETSEILKNEEKNIQGTTDQNNQISSMKGDDSSAPLPTFKEPLPNSVSQALDALTGFDDSTQMAVNNVFGVIENMIDQFEKENQQPDEKQTKNEVHESGSAVSSKVLDDTDEHKSEKKEYDNNGLSSKSETMQVGNPVNLPNINLEDHAKLEQDVGKELGKKMLPYDSDSFVKNDMVLPQGNSNLDDKIVNATGFSAGDKNREKGNREKDLIDYVSFAENPNKFINTFNFPLYITRNPCGDSLYSKSLATYSPKKPSMRSLDLDSTNDLYLEYFPEDGQWKLLDKLESTNDSTQGKPPERDRPSEESDMDKIVEPSYIILDGDLKALSMGKYECTDDFDTKNNLGDAKIDELACLVKNIVVDDLKVELSRRLGIPDMDAVESNLLYELEQVAEAVSLVAKANISGFVKTHGTLHVDPIINAISSSIQDAPRLRKILPVGVIVGSSLAALRKYFQVTLLDEDRYEGENECIEIDHDAVISKKGPVANPVSSISRVDETQEAKILNNNSVMVAVTTAALGASAILANQTRNEKDQIPCYLNEIRDRSKEDDRLDEAGQEKSKNNIVSSFAEKAMSIAGPVVPTKDGGKVDHERLVAMLGNLGQKGGILRLIGKAALLWGGIRGAISLTDKLISFLRIAERPLLQRILGFIFMVLVLWSPIVIPLFPTLMRSWTTKSSIGITKYGCIGGLYAALMILVMIWGRRIRGYESPLKQYGLDLSLSLPKLHKLLKGFIGGFMLVISTHLVNVLLGYARFTLPSDLPSASVSAILWFKVYGSMLLLATQGLAIALSVATVEELLFRSWLPEEIALDLGYHRANIISGLVFSLLQRSLPLVPGLWLLSFALFGAKQRSNYDLLVPIGIRGGLMTTNFILHRGGFLTYRPGTPFWITGSSPWEPFGGTVGLSFVLILALVLYPWVPVTRNRISRVIRR